VNAPTIRLYTVDLDAIDQPTMVPTDTARRRRQARHQALERAAAKAGVEIVEPLPACRGNGHSQPTVRGGDLAVSVTWAGRWGVVAFAPCRLGIDAELLRGAPRPVTSALSPREAAALEGLSGRGRSESFLRLWTAKEAVAKADGRGLALPLHELDAAPVLGDGEATVVVNGNSWHVAVLAHEFPDGEPAAIGIATDRQTGPVTWPDEEDEEWT
jgi:phosphopantetheinyl transferase